MAQVANWQGRKVYAYTKPDDVASQAYARSLGVVWAGATDETPPEKLDAAIIFAPVGVALQAVRKVGG
ncbi:MAG: hypothetical protein NTV43_16160 [Methylococcales bacterium]|nr:hypothetical protein [Methylococcales bacterium]